MRYGFPRRSVGTRLGLIAEQQIKLLDERCTALISATVSGIDVRDWFAPAHSCAHDRACPANEESVMAISAICTSQAPPQKQQGRCRMRLLKCSEFSLNRDGEAYLPRKFVALSHCLFTAAYYVLIRRKVING